MVEIQYSKLPISIVFTAGSLVHHRYRTENGSSRRCIIAAFHLATDNPGTLIHAQDSSSGPKTLSDLLLGHQDATSREEFISLISDQASVIQSKISDILNPSHNSTLIDASQFELSEHALSEWREIVINAPSASSIKLSRNNLLYFAQDSVPRSILIQKLTDVMAYDKHGLLDLVLYEDG